MNEIIAPHDSHQENVNAYFQSQASFWKDIYTRDSVQAEIYRERQAAVLAWIDGLALAPGSQVLEIGCGAGFLSIALAQRGLRVQAIDPAEAMVEQARRHAEQAGVAGRLTVGPGDANALPFEDRSFDLVLAIGVMGWLTSPELGMQEMARVTRPDGYVIFTGANQMGLHYLFDPLKNPALAPLKRYLKTGLQRIGLRLRPLQEMPQTVVAYHFHDRRLIDAILTRAELIKLESKTLGFGPFTFFHFRVIPESPGVRLHHGLQRLADRGMPVIRSTGMSHLILARKRGEASN